MAGIQLSGLASGMDWNSVVDQLIQLERIPQNRMRAEQATFDKRISALGDLSSKMSALQTALSDLNDTASFKSRSVALGDEDSTVLSASADAGTANGSYAITISQLATATSLAGQGNIGSAISATADVSGVTLSSMNSATAVSAGTFSVNGETVTISLTDSLQDVFDAISTATGGDVTAAYDPATDKISLSSASEIVLGNPNDTSNFLAAVKLFSNGTGTVASESSLGALDMDNSIASSGLAAAITAVDVDGNGSFTINGVSIDYNVNDDGLDDIMARINSSDARVTISYDRTNDSFTLENSETGSLGMSVSESAGGLLEAMGLVTGATQTLGVNAKFTIDGSATITSTSNTLSADAHGIEGLDITAKALGSETVTVSADTETSQGKIENFIEKYNSLIEFIDAKTAITTASDGDVTTNILTSNREVTTMARTLRSKLFSPVSGLEGTIKRLQDIGIDFVSGSDKLEIEDSSRLTEALEDDPDIVASLFDDETDGLVTRLDTYLESVTDSDGIIESQIELMNNQKDRLDLQIDNLERQIAMHEEAMTKAFLRMEEVQSQVNGQLQMLTNSLPKTSS